MFNDENYAFIAVVLEQICIISWWLEFVCIQLRKFSNDFIQMAFQKDDILTG